MGSLHTRDLSGIVNVIVEALVLTPVLGGGERFAVLLDEAKDRSAGCLALLPNHILRGGEACAAVFPVAVALPAVELVVDDVPHQIVGGLRVALGCGCGNLGKNGKCCRGKEHDGSKTSRSRHWPSAPHRYDPVPECGSCLPFRVNPF